MGILGELIRGILLILPGFIFSILIAMLYECKISQLLKGRRNKVHFYVARDKSGKIYLYFGKPERRSSCFLSLCGTCSNLIADESHFKDVGLNPYDFKNLKWENEPVEVFINMEDQNMKQRNKDLLLKDSCTIKDCESNEPGTIPEIVPHPEKFNPKNSTMCINKSRNCNRYY